MPAPSVPFWTDFDQGASDPAFLTRPGAWDIVYVGSGSGVVQMPGLCRVKIHKKKHKKDDKSPAGSDGSTPTFLGWAPAKFDIAVKIWTPDQLARFVQLLPNFSGSWKTVRLKKSFPPLPEIDDPQAQQKLAAYKTALNAPAPTGRAFQPCDISHPQLTILGVNAFWMEQFLGFEPTSEDSDERVGILECWEYNKTKESQIVTPKGAKADVTNIPQALRLKQPQASNPKTDPSLTEAVPLPQTGGASGSF